MLENRTGYSKTSIAIHWLTAVFVVALFFTGEGKGAVRNFHIAAGAVVGVFLIYRMGWRLKRGMTEKPDQPALLNLLSTLVIWGLLLSILVATITGYFLPWTRAASINIFDLFSIPSPISANHALHEFMEEVHEISSHLPIPLIGLHILGALKHHFIDKDDVAKRIVVPVNNGR